MTTKIKMGLHHTIIDELQPGETIRVNHTDCTAGADYRRRLYLTRVMAKPDLTIGYCHNCQESGTMHTTKYQSYRKSKHAKVIPSSSLVSVVEEPKGIDRVLIDWPSEAKAWAIRCGISQVDLNLYRIGYDVSTDKIYLPRYEVVLVDTDGCVNLNGYQLRLLNGKGPKYTTVVNEKDKGYTRLAHHSSIESTSVTVSVVVEDLISGIHVIKALCTVCNIDVFVNYGVQINIRMVHELRSYPRTIVWLDNDSNHVKEQAKHYARTIQLHSGKAVKVVKSYHDPKLQNNEIIKKVVMGTIDG